MDRLLGDKSNCRVIYRVSHMFENNLQLTFLLTGLRYQSPLWI
jgi:hypothetical protein